MLFVGVFIGPINKFSLIFTPHFGKFIWLISGVSLILLIHFIKNNETKIIKHQIPISMIGFISYASLTYLWSINTYEAELHLLFYVTYFLIFVTYLTFFTKDKILFFEKSMILLTFIVSLLAIVQTFFPFLFLNFYNSINPPSLSFGNKNMLGHLIIMLLPITLVKVIYDKKTNFYYLIVLFLALLTIFLINAMQLLIALAFMIVLLLAYHYRKRKTTSFPKTLNFKFLFSLFFVFLIISSYIFFIINTSKIDTKNTEDVGLMENFISIQQEKISSYVASFNELNIFDNEIFNRNQRLPMWVNSMKLIKDNLFFGVGVGQWAGHYVKYYDSVLPDHLVYSHRIRSQNPHNEFIRVFSNLGLFGFAILLILILQSIREIWKAINSSEHGNTALGLSLGLVGFFVISNFSIPVETFFAPALAMIYLAIILIINNVQENQIIISTRFRLIFKSFFTIFLCFIVYSGFQVALAKFIDDSILSLPPGDPNFQKNITSIALKAHEVKSNNPYYLFVAAISSMHSGDNDSAKKYLNQAIARNPHNVTYIMNLLSLAKDSKNYNDVIEVAKKILAIDPKEIRALVPLTIAYYNINDLDNANKTYKKLKESFEHFKGRDGFDLKYQEIVNFALSVGDYSYAAYVQNEYIVRNSSPTANSYAVYGIALYNISGKRNQAKNAFIKALEIDPEVFIPPEIAKALAL